MGRLSERLSAPLSVSVVGGSGYVGGELLRLLLFHPRVAVLQATSRRLAGEWVHFVHPNLRSAPPLRWSHPDELEACDLLFLALPHGSAMAEIDRFTALAERVVDTSADFRLRSADDYRQWYGKDHQAPAWLERFVYGLPELHREQIAGARWVSGVGCNATASLLALLPLTGTDLVDWQRGCIVDLKVGSSEAGSQASDASHHPVRAGAMRSFAPTGHRHTAEVEQGLRERGVTASVELSCTAVEAVRGVLATAHLYAREGVVERDLFRAFRNATTDQPFLRLVKERTGLYRYPEPKILAGSNFAEIAFELDARSGRIVAMAALDNLMKGAAGSAVQSMNLMMGWDERDGLGFPGLHPI